MVSPDLEKAIEIFVFAFIALNLVAGLALAMFFVYIYKKWTSGTHKCGEDESWRKK
jgi:hypothetical protein